MRTRWVHPTRPTIMAALVGLAGTIGLLALLMWSADPALAAEPALRIVPAPAQAGTPVKAFGQGFCGRATCASIDIVLAGNTVATGRPAPDGTFNLTFTIRAAPGQYAVTATQNDSGRRLQASTALL